MHNLIKKSIALVMVMLLLSSPVTVFAQPQFRMVELTPEAMEIVLEDFDYLAEWIMEVLPTLGVAERVFGIPMETILEWFRETITDNEPMISLFSEGILGPDIPFLMGERWASPPDDPRYLAAEYLFSSLLFNFGIALGGFSHLSPIDLITLESTLFPIEWIIYHAPRPGEPYYEYWNLSMTRIHHRNFNAPSARWFYGMDYMNHDMQMEEDDVMSELGWVMPDNITTDIIVPGRVAYIGVESFMSNMLDDAAILFPFYEQIQDYEHLIIDLRGNMGGLAASFPLNFVAMLIDEPLHFQTTEFFRSSPRIEEFYVNPVPIMFGAELYRVMPAEEYVRSRNLPYFPMGDLNYLDSVLVWDVYIAPFSDAIPFRGDIWLLVDEWSASASQMAAVIAQNGFATIVGEPTSAVTGTIHTYVPLPNTGILFRIDLGLTTDPQGRIFEETGVVPDIPNMPGLDALATVLAVIGVERVRSVPSLPEHGMIGTGFEVGLGQGQTPSTTRFSIFDDLDVIIYNGEVFVSLRDIATHLGYTVTWDEPTRTAILSGDGELGAFVFIPVDLVGAVIIDGTTYIPVDLLESLFL